VHVSRPQEVAARNAEFEAALKAADSPYMEYVLKKKQECEWWEPVRLGRDLFPQ